jgi:hypothetical protein
MKYKLYLLYCINNILMKKTTTTTVTATTGGKGQAPPSQSRFNAASYVGPGVT